MSITCSCSRTPDFSCSIPSSRKPLLSRFGVVKVWWETREEGGAGDLPRPRRCGLRDHLGRSRGGDCRAHRFDEANGAEAANSEPAFAGPSAGRRRSCTSKPGGGGGGRIANSEGGKNNEIRNRGALPRSALLPLRVRGGGDTLQVANGEASSPIRHLPIRHLGPGSDRGFATGHSLLHDVHRADHAHLPARAGRRRAARRSSASPAMPARSARRLFASTRCSGPEGKLIAQGYDREQVRRLPSSVVTDTIEARAP